MFPLLLFFISGHAQKMVTNEKKIIEASHSMKEHGHVLFSCIIYTDLDSCIAHFEKKAKNSYEKHVTANTIFGMDPQTSYRLHEEAYKSKPTELPFMEEYAIELHRKGKYGEAVVLYEKWAEVHPENFKVKALLADCYMNTGRVEMSVENWTLADHSKHRIEIETIIHEVYGRTDQDAKRSYYRNEIKKGHTDFFYDLFYLDLNWESDWWDIGVVNEDFLNTDILLLNEKLDKTSEMYSVIEAYVEIKNPLKTQYANGIGDISSLALSSVHRDPATREYNEILLEVEKEILNIINNSIAPDDSLYTEEKIEKSAAALRIEKVLTTHNLLLNGSPLPPQGKIVADFVEVCLTNSVLTKEQFFKERGAGILKKAAEQKDVELFQLCARLLPSNSAAVPAINKRGWKEFTDERFAWAYLLNALIAKKLDEAELDKAVADFPNSSRIYLIKLQKAKLDNRDLTPYLVELIKREFKRIDSGVGLGASYGTGHNSNPLRLYFEILRRHMQSPTGK